MEVRKPNFFILGTAKAATTSLHEYLSAHPDVFMSPEKEPQYLAVQDGKFISVDGYVNPAHAIRSYPPVIEAEDRYHALFDGATDEAVVGEFSIYICTVNLPRSGSHQTVRMPRLSLSSEMRSTVPIRSFCITSAMVVR